MAKLIDRFYWVTKDRLMAGCYPGALAPAKADRQLNCLLANGIRHMVSLMEPHEKSWYGRKIVPYAGAMQVLAEGSGCRVTYEQLSIKDLSVPTTKKMGMILDHIDAVLAGGRPVFVHCLGGIGRTGTVVGCWLIRHGLADRHNVLDRLQDLRRHTADKDRRSPDTDEQLAFVREWKIGQ